MRTHKMRLASLMGLTTGQLKGTGEILFTEAGIPAGMGSLIGNLYVSATITGILKGIGKLIGSQTFQFTPEGQLVAAVLFNRGVTNIAFDAHGNLKGSYVRCECICGTSQITILIEGQSPITIALAGTSQITKELAANSQITNELTSQSEITVLLESTSLLDLRDEQCIY